MKDEIKSSKYRKLKKQLIQIKNKMSKLDTYNNKLTKAMDKALLIDNKIINENEINIISVGINNISSKLSDTILPNIDSKI